MTGSERLTALIEDWAVAEFESAYLKGEKRARSNDFVVRPSAETGLNLIKVNVDLSKIDRQRTAASSSLSKIVVGQAMKNYNEPLS